MLKNVSPLYYWLILYRRRWAILGIAVIAVVTAAVFSKLYPPMYESETVFFIPANDTNSEASFYSVGGPQGIQLNALLPAGKDDALKPYIGYLKSRDLAIAVQEEFPHKPLKFYLRNDVDFEVTEEGLLRMYSRDRDPDRAAAIANAYVRQLDELIGGFARESLKANVATLQNNIAAVRKALRKNDERTAALLASRKIASYEDEKRALTTLKENLYSSLDASEISLTDVTARLQASSEQLAKEGELLAYDSFDLNDPEIQSLRTELNRLSAEIASQKVKVGARNVSLEALQAEYAATEESLRKAIDRSLASEVKPTDSTYEQIRARKVLLLVEQAGLEAEQKGNLKALESVSERIGSFVEHSPEFEEVQREGRSLLARYEVLLSSLDETRVQLARPVSFVTVTDPAHPPSRPSFPILPLNVVVSLLVGLAVGTFYAFFVNYIETVDQVSTRSLVKAILAEPDSDA